jgi:hypothetical protein
LADGVGVSIQTFYYFAHDPAVIISTKSSIGGGGKWVSGTSYAARDVPVGDADMWSPCGGSGILNVSKRMNFTAIDPVKANLTESSMGVTDQNIRIDWNKC